MFTTKNYFWFANIITLTRTEKLEDLEKTQSLGFHGTTKKEGLQIKVINIK